MPDDRVRLALQALVTNGLRVMVRLPQDLHALDRQILVDLEFQYADPSGIATTCSLDNSAAYAIAARTSFRSSEG